ncbi:hypothetical protein GGS20DRAFT_530567 [Poronia punctata]|nr:hypothetical protein GGS20DRAFT_530567 [Poronia punctata]
MPGLRCASACMRGCAGADGRSLWYRSNGGIYVRLLLYLLLCYRQLCRAELVAEAVQKTVIGCTVSLYTRS